MQEEHPHPLLAQVPLTVSPFLNLPTATPLPYTYKQLPSTLPPSILSSPPAVSAADNQTQPTPETQQPAYILSSTGQTAASPDTILASCHALQQHLAQLEASARATLQKWEERRNAEDLAEKRRVAPGWLDGDVKLLVPENVGDGGDAAQRDVDMGGEGEEAQRNADRSVGVKAVVERRDGVPDPREGEELDRAFGGLDLNRR